jgi:hypothetical protein
VKRTTRIVTCSALLIIGGAIGSSTFAQEASSAQSAPPATPPARTSSQQAKPKKVWTNDSIKEVEKPSDVYQDQKEASAATAEKESQEQQQPKANAMPSEPGVAPPVTLKIPKTVEEANAQIAQARDMLDNFQNLSSNSTDRLSTETDPTVRATLEQKMSLLKFDLETTSSDLKTLEKKRDELEAEAKDHSGSPTTAQSQP